MTASPRYDALRAQRVAEAERQEKRLANAQRRRKPVSAESHRETVSTESQSQSQVSPSSLTTESHAEPWEVEGVSRATYFRRKRQAEAGR
jgi:hypothetical protein